MPGGAGLWTTAKGGALAGLPRVRGFWRGRKGFSRQGGPRHRGRTEAGRGTYAQIAERLKEHGLQETEASISIKPARDYRSGVRSGNDCGAGIGVRRYDL
jgi:hypothetical protein